MQSWGFFDGPTREDRMVKVEAVVIRERVETVLDAVEEETGHVGVTVIEAIGRCVVFVASSVPGPSLPM